jgi:hypothetical protein
MPRWGSAAGRRRTFGRALLVGSGSQMRRAPGVGSVSQSGGRRLAAADRTIAPTAAVLDDLEHHYGPLASRASLKTLPPSRASLCSSLPQHDAELHESETA